jgi:hypothetical protein
MNSALKWLLCVVLVLALVWAGASLIIGFPIRSFTVTQTDVQP